MKIVTAVEASKNEKIGLVHATYVPQVNTCPPTCPFRDEGCYAESGKTGIITRRLNKAVEATGATGLEIAQAQAIAIDENLSGRLDLRQKVVGDTPSNEAATITSEAALKRLARHKRTSWEYTHNWRNLDRKAFGKVSVLASCETVEGVIEARDQGWSAAVVVDQFPNAGTFELGGGQKAFACPQQTHGVQCVDCRLCLRENEGYLERRNISIAFEAHGARYKNIQQRGTLVQIGSL